MAEAFGPMTILEGKTTNLSPESGDPGSCYPHPIAAFAESESELVEPSTSLELALIGALDDFPLAVAGIGLYFGNLKTQFRYYII